MFIAATVAAGAGDAVFLMVKCPSSPAIPTAPESRRLFNNAAAHTGADSDHNNVRTVSGSTLPLLADDCAVGVIGNACPEGDNALQEWPLPGYRASWQCARRSR